jgi:hypothetical protein
MNTGTTGNTGFHNPHTGQLNQPTPFLHNPHTHRDLISPFYSPCQGNDCFWVHNPQPFHPWEVALAVVAAVVLVATVVLFVRRLRTS